MIHPRVVEALTWFAQNLAFSFGVGMFYGVFLVDLVSSLGIVARVRRFAIDNQIQIRYEELKQEYEATGNVALETVNNASYISSAM